MSTASPQPVDIRRLGRDQRRIDRVTRIARYWLGVAVQAKPKDMATLTRLTLLVLDAATAATPFDALAAASRVRFAATHMCFQHRIRGAA
jgi:hypothetical protein